MSFSRLLRMRNTAIAGWKWFLSFRTREWTLTDYPLCITFQESDPAYSAPRFSQHPYRAFIINWHLSGTGESPEDARADLEGKFTTAALERKREGQSMPRPGTRVPIAFAPQDKVSVHSDLSEDFVRRVLGLEWAWISDESSLWDFHTEQTNDHLHRKIQEVYGVDVSDIESAKLWEILQRIERSGTRSEL